MAATTDRMRFALLMTGFLGVAGCGAPQPGAPRDGAALSGSDQDGPRSASAPVVPVNARFECDGTIVPVVFEGGRVTVSLADRDLTLPQVPAASGARYGNGRDIFWSHGDEATIEIDGRSQTCRALPDPWEAARVRGIDFRAVGQEPGWFLEIDHDRSMHLVYDYMEREATTPAPVAVVSGARTTYTAATEAHRLTVIVEERPCRDSMSGEPFPSTVIVTIDGRELRGCGRALGD